MLLALALLFAAPTNYPAYTDYVVDAANVLDAASQQHLKGVASQLDHAGVAQIAVLTITDAMLGDDSIEDYAAGVFKKWGLGHDKKRSDGIVVVIKPGKEGHRQTKVETGYGVEGVLPDGKLGALYEQNARPFIKQDQYGQAAVHLVDAIAAVLQGDAAAGGDMAPAAGGRRGGTGQGIRGGDAQPDNLGGLAVTVLCMLGLVIALVTSGSRRQFPGKKMQAGAVGLTGVSIASLVFAGSGAGFIALVIGLIIVAVVWTSIRAHKCPKDGSWMNIDEEVLDQPTYWSEGLAHVSQRCTNARCGYRNDYDKRIPRKQRTVVTGGGGGGGSFGGGGGGGGDGFSGGGGGESGGGGISRSD